MGYLVPFIIIVFGMAAEYVIEISADVSTEVILDGETGIEPVSTPIVADRIVDMRPETSIATRQPDLPDLLPPTQ